MSPCSMILSDKLLGKDTLCKTKCRCTQEKFEDVKGDITRSRTSSKNRQFNDKK